MQEDVSTANFYPLPVWRPRLLKVLLQWRTRAALVRWYGLLWLARWWGWLDAAVTSAHEHFHFQKIQFNNILWSRRMMNTLLYTGSECYYFQVTLPDLEDKLKGPHCHSHLTFKSHSCFASLWHKESFQYTPPLQVLDVNVLDLSSKHSGKWQNVKQA